MNTRVSYICSNKETRDALIAQAHALRGVEFTAHIGSVRSTLLAVLQKEQPDVVLLDFPMADEQALQQIEATVLKMPGIPVVLVSPDVSMEFMKRAMRAGVRDILPGPANLATVQRAVDYVQETKSITSRYGDGVGNMLAVVPVKGGAGATFLATNLAYALAALNQRVLLIDLNLYFGDAAMYITDRRAATSVVDLAKQAQRMDAALLESSVLQVQDKLHVLAAPSLPYELEEVAPDTLDAIFSLARCEYDFVILDAGRHLTPATVRALDRADKIYLVLQLSLPALQNTKRLMTVFQGLGYASDKLQVVVNRFEKNGPIRLEQVELSAKVPVRRTIPASDADVSASVNQGVPLLKLYPKDVVSRALQEWAKELSPVSVKTSKSWYQTLTGSL
jgi:pilus assembly protein CpaE